MNKRFTLVDALFCFLLIFSLMIISLLILKIPAAIALLSTGIVVIIYAVIRGTKWNDVEKDIFELMGKILFPAMILLAVGMLIGIWMLSGTIPLIIDYGLQVLTPSNFLIMSVIICTITSFLIGTSWGTIGTVGIALVGVSVGLDVPLHFAAAAIITGTFFGDKLSPLSDSTIIASALSSVNLIEHIKHMLWTTVPGYLISLGLFGYLGTKISGSASLQNNESINLISKTLHSTFNLSPLLLIPPAIVFILIILKAPVLPVFIFGIISAGALSLIFQGSSLSLIATTLNTGYVPTTEVALVAKMLNQGGLLSMFDTVTIFFASSILIAPLKTTGILDLIVETITKKVHSEKSMMLSTLGLHGSFYTLTGNYSSSFAVIGPLLTPIYDKYGVPKRNLSRALEDTGTAFGPAIPWGITAVFITSTLGVTISDYFWLVPMIYTGVIFNIIYTLTSFKIYDKNKATNFKKNENALTIE